VILELTQEENVKSQYEFLDMIGRGGFSEVFVARNKKENNSRVAVKIVNKVFSY
jgi:hypothetical protein